MKYTHFEQENPQSGIIFFCGWGMGPEIVSHLDSRDFNLLIFYDYNNLFNKDVVELFFENNRKVHLIAWSFGVWVAEKSLNSYEDTFTSALAINGTTAPINRNFGIPPEVFNLTLSKFNQNTRDKFIYRMCGSKEVYQNFMKTPPNRTLESQQKELKYLGENIIKGPHKHSRLFKSAIAGTEDKIIPFKNQVNWWKQKVELFQKPIPHFPFDKYQSWKEVLEDETR